MKDWLLSLFGCCAHQPGWPARDPKTGEEYQPCVRCAARLPLKVSFARTLPLPEKQPATGIERNRQ